MVFLKWATESGKFIKQSTNWTNSQLDLMTVARDLLLLLLFASKGNWRFNSNSNLRLTFLLVLESTLYLELVIAIT